MTSPKRFKEELAARRPFSACLLSLTQIQDFLALSSTQSVGLQISKFLHSVFGAENKTKHKHPLKSLNSHNTPWQCFTMGLFNFSAPPHTRVPHRGCLVRKEQSCQHPPGCGGCGSAAPCKLPTSAQPKAQPQTMPGLKRSPGSDPHPRFASPS